MMYNFQVVALETVAGGLHHVIDDVSGRRLLEVREDEHGLVAGDARAVEEQALTLARQHVRVVLPDHASLACW